MPKYAILSTGTDDDLGEILGPCGDNYEQSTLQMEESHSSENRQT